MSIISFSLKARGARLRRSESGAAAAEFGLIAPILIFSALTALDFGLAFSSKMGIDHVVRAGAAAAIENASEEKIEDVMRGAEPERTSGTPEDEPDLVIESNPLEVSANRFCVCPGAEPGETVDCTAICPGPLAPYVYYKLDAHKMYNGILLRSVELNSAARIQVR
jgi:pilus assembly protein CpaE